MVSEKTQAAELALTENQRAFLKALILFRSVNFNQLNQLWQIYTGLPSKIATSTLNRFVDAKLIKKHVETGKVRGATYSCDLTEGIVFEALKDEYPLEVSNNLYAKHRGDGEHDTKLRDFLIAQLKKAPKSLKVYFPGRSGKKGKLVPDAVVLKNARQFYIEYDNLTESINDFLVKIPKYIAQFEAEGTKWATVVFIFKTSSSTRGRMRNFARKAVTSLRTIDDVAVNEWLQTHSNIRFYFWDEKEGQLLFPTLFDRATVEKTLVGRKEVMYFPGDLTSLSRAISKEPLQEEGILNIAQTAHGLKLKNPYDFLELKLENGLPIEHESEELDLFSSFD